MAIAHFEGGSPVTLALAIAAQRASDEGRSFRVETGTDRDGRNWIKWKVGEGVWLAPTYEDAWPPLDRG